MLAFNAFGALAVYALQRLQAYLPWNPQQMSAVTADSSFNTAVSFITNTNWQGYGGESTMSYLTQMLGLGVQNFLSAATGIAVLVAMIRGFTLKQAQQIGNFWVDLTRSTLYVLLPLSLLLAVVLAGQGVVQSFKPYQTAALVNPIMVDEPVTDAAGNPVKDAQGNAQTKSVRVDTQTIPLGPAASQIAIKQLGTNGGGFFNVNSAHPFENPTPLSNFLEVLAILLIPAALCYSFGRMVGDTRQGWAVLAAMLVLLIPLLGLTAWAEGAQQSGVSGCGRADRRRRSSRAATWRARRRASALPIRRSGRPPPPRPPTARSMPCTIPITPLGGLIPMWLIQLGEVIFGGVGSGLYGMLVFAIIAVFIAGLMVGRTPEYLGKKLESFEMKMASLVILIPPFFALVVTAIAVSLRCRPRRHRQSGRARLLRDSVRVLFGGGQQRQRVRRPIRQYAVLQHAARHRHVGFALLADRAGAGDRRQPRGQETRARRRRHAAHAHAAVRGAAGRNGPDRRRAGVLSGAGARADRRRAAVSWALIDAAALSMPHRTDLIHRGLQ